MSTNYEKSFGALLKSLDEDLAVPQYNYAYASTLKKLEEKFVSDCMQSYRDGKQVVSVELARLCAKRRAAAFSKFAQDAHNQYAEQYPNLCVEDVLYDTNILFSASSFDYYNEQCYLVYAIALWMLDKLVDAGNIQKAIEFLPAEIGEEHIVAFPDFEDSGYSNELIAKMAYVIENRNGENAAVVTKAATRQTAIRNYIQTNPDPNLSCRERFDAIMTLIPKDVIEHAARRFAEKEWEFFELCLDTVNEYRTKEIALLNKLKTTISENDKKKSHIDAQNASYLASGGPLGIPYANPREAATALNKARSEAEATLQSTMRQREDMFALLEECEELDNGKRSIRFLSFSADILDVMVDEGHLEKKHAERFEDFSVDNPFETLFGYLFLLDSGSNLAWLNGQVMFVILAAIKQLPWMLCFVPEDAVEEELAVPEDWIQEEKKLYERKYSIDEEKISLSQALFGNTDIVPPRNISAEYGRAKVFEKFGFGEKEAFLLEKYCTMARFGSYKEGYMRQIHSAELDSVLEKTKPKEDPAKKDAAALRKEISRLENDIDILHKNRNEFRKKCEKLEEENNSLEAEIAELRSLLQTAKKEQAKPEEKENISFPYTLKHRFVVFGGHPSWLRAIKPLLDNIRFIDDTVVPDANLIRNADAVWFQSNAYSHAFYYKIVETTRTHNIPLEYFSFASAEKCAEQIAEYDKNFSEENDAT